MLGVPFLRRALNQLFAAIFSILLSLVKKLNGLGHLWNLYLVRDAVRADQNSPVSEAVAGNYAHSWCRDYAARLGQVVAEAARHGQAGLPRVPAPYAHRSDLLTGDLGLELVKDAAYPVDSFLLLGHFWFMIHRQLLTNKLLLLLVITL